MLGGVINPPFGGGKGPDMSKMPPELKEKQDKILAEMKAHFADLHEKYGDPKTSGLEVTVTSGKNAHDLILP